METISDTGNIERIDVIRPDDAFKNDVDTVFEIVVAELDEADFAVNSLDKTHLMSSDVKEDTDTSESELV